MDYLVRIFKSVANERRIRLLECLLERREQSLGELAERLDMPYKTAARNLKILEKAMLVKREMLNARAFFSPETSSRLIYGREILNMVKNRMRRKKRR